MSVPWIKKYSPKHLKDMYGQSSAVEELKSFIQNYKKQKKKAMLLYGLTGTGKTSSVYAAANELDLELLEVNASDFRTEEQLNLTVGNASQQRSLFFKQKIILVDEIDGIAGREDRGGIATLQKLIETTSYPLILTANDPWDSKFSGLRKVCVMVEFQELDFKDMVEILKKICSEEKVKADDETLKTLARRAGGDLRGAITDLQTLSSEKKEIDRAALDELGGRKQTESIKQALVKVFKTGDPKIAINAFDNIDEDINECFLWIDENLPKEYNNAEDLARAYESLSKADVFRGRIRRWQHWRYLVYVNALLTAGIAVAKTEKNKVFVDYEKTKRILKLWMAKQKNMKKKAIAEKIAAKTHSSKKEIIQSALPYLQIIFKNDPKQAELMADEFELDKEEMEWLVK